MSNIKCQISNNIHWILVVLVYIGSITASAEAVTLSNSNYNVEMGNLNTTAGRKSNSSFKLSDTVGQIAPGLSTATSYKVRAGCQYINSIINFSFSANSPF